MPDFYPTPEEFNRLADRVDAESRKHLEHVTQSIERWNEQWRWKDRTDERLDKVEAGMGGIRETQAASAAEMKAQVRLSSFLGSIAGGVLVGLIIWVLKGGP